ASTTRGSRRRTRSITTKRSTASSRALRSSTSIASSRKTWRGQAAAPPKKNRERIEEEQRTNERAATRLAEVLMMARHFAQNLSSETSVRFSSSIVTIIGTLIVATAASGCADKSEPDRQALADRWSAHVTFLADDAMRGRETGSAEHRKAA